MRVRKSTAKLQGFAGQRQAREIEKIQKCAVFTRTERVCQGGVSRKCLIFKQTHRLGILALRMLKNILKNR